MNTFELTHEQEHHWDVMKDNETFAGEGRHRSNDDKRMAQFSAAHIYSEPEKRLHFLRSNKREEGKFYSLGGTARNLRYGYNRKDGAKSVSNFTDQVEEAGFDDSNFIRMLYVLHSQIIENESEKSRTDVNFETLIDASDAFIEGGVEAKLEYNDTADSAMEKHSSAQIKFQTFLEELALKIDQYGQTLSAHPLFHNIEHVKGQIIAIRELCADSRLNTSASGHLTIELPDKFVADFDDSLHSVDTGVHNPFVAKGIFLHKLGLVPHIKYFLTLANIIAYVERVAKKDSEVEGVFPDLCDPEDDALVLNVKEFAHPAIYRGKSIRNHFSDTYRTLGHDIFRKLSDANLISQHTDERGTQDYYWNQGVTMADVEQFIQDNDIDFSPAENIAMLFSRAAFVPFKDIHLNTRNRIQLVTGANFNGKSTYMQAIGYLFHQAATARKFRFFFRGSGEIRGSE